MLRNVTTHSLALKTPRRNEGLRSFFVTQLYINSRLSHQKPRFPQPVDRSGKGRLLRCSCGKLWQTCGESVEKMWKRFKQLVETVWNLWGKFGQMLRIANFEKIWTWRYFVILVSESVDNMLKNSSGARLDQIYYLYLAWLHPLVGCQFRRSSHPQLFSLLTAYPAA